MPIQHGGRLLTGTKCRLSRGAYTLVIWAKPKHNNADSRTLSIASLLIALHEK